MRDREKPERGDARSARRKALLGVLASGPAMIATLSAFDALKPYGEYLTRIVVGYEQASAEFWGCVALQLSFDLPFSPGALSLLALLALPAWRMAVLSTPMAGRDPLLVAVNGVSAALLFGVFSKAALVVSVLVPIVVALGLLTHNSWRRWGHSKSGTVRWIFRKYLNLNYSLGIDYNDWNPFAQIALPGLVAAVGVLAWSYLTADMPGDVCLGVLVLALALLYVSRGDLTPAYVFCGAGGILVLDFAARMAPEVGRILDSKGL